MTTLEDHAKTVEYRSTQLSNAVGDLLFELERMAGAAGMESPKPWSLYMLNGLLSAITSTYGEAQVAELDNTLNRIMKEAKSDD